jgi:hypothetical protein
MKGNDNADFSYNNWGLPVGAGRPRPLSEAVVEGEVLKRGMVE